VAATMGILSVVDGNSRKKAATPTNRMENRDLSGGLIW
jgi:hypothetical protein